MKQKLESLQVGRGIAAFAVLLFHSQVLMNYVHPDSIFVHAFRFGSAGVDFFFVLSGFLMVYVHRRDFGQPGRLRSYFLKRVTRIYPIYWALCLFLVPLVLLVPSTMQNAGKVTLSTLWTSIFLLPHAGPRLLGVTWTLEYEVLFYLMFAVFFFSARFGLAFFAVWFLGIVGVGIWGPATLSVIGGAPTITPFLLAFAMNLHVAEFMAGMGIAWLIQRGFRIERPIWLLAASLLAAACFLVYASHLPDGQTLRIETVGFGLSATAIVLSVILVEVRHRLHAPAWLTLVGDASYSIYLTHFLVVSFAVMVAKHTHKVAAIPPGLLLLVIVAVAMTFGILTHLLVERPLLKLTSSRKSEKPAMVAV
jgi:peptidoglycan/LPS O-acetylase OafA/YrhL